MLEGRGASGATFIRRVVMSASAMLNPGMIRSRIRDHVDRTLTWRQDRPLHSEWTLKLGDEVVAHLELPRGRKPGKAVAHARAWEVQRPSRLSPRLAIRDAWTERLMVEVRPRFWAAEISAPSGRYRYARSFVGTGRVYTADGRLVLELQPKLRWSTSEADLVIKAPIGGQADLPELVLAAWMAHVVGSRMLVAAGA